MHGAEIDPEAAASNAAAKMQKKMALRARQAEQKAEMAKVEKKLGKIKKEKQHEKDMQLAGKKRASELSIMTHSERASGRRRAQMSAVLLCDVPFSVLDDEHLTKDR